MTDFAILRASEKHFKDLTFLNQCPLCIFQFSVRQARTSSPLLSFAHNFPCSLPLLPPAHTTSLFQLACLIHIQKYTRLLWPPHSNQRACKSPSSFSFDLPGVSQGMRSPTWDVIRGAQPAADVGAVSVGVKQQLFCRLCVALHPMDMVRAKWRCLRFKAKGSVSALVLTSSLSGDFSSFSSLFCSLCSILHLLFSAELKASSFITLSKLVDWEPNTAERLLHHLLPSPPWAS